MEWFPWYPDLYEQDTLHLTPAQDGIYRRLIDWYMTKRRPIPDSDQALAAAARIGLDEWLEHAPVVRAFFVPKNGLLHLKRCDQLLDAQDNRRDRYSARAEKAAKIRWQTKPRDINGLDATSMQQACSKDAKAMLADARETETGTKKESPPFISPPSTASPNGSASLKATSNVKRGTRLPPDWEPTAADREFAERHGLDPYAVADEFRDYWHARAGAGGVKLDWSATWRNWCRRSKPARKHNGYGNGLTEGFARFAARASGVDIGESDGAAASLLDAGDEPWGS